MVTFSTVIAAAVATMIFCVTLLCFSLRDFSRSRLEELCRRHKTQNRFGVILQNHEKCLLLAELLLIVLIVVAVWMAASTSWLGDISFPEGQHWQAVVSRLTHVASLIITIGFLFVALPWTLSRVIGEAFLYRTWPLVYLVSRLASPVWSAAAKLDLIVHRIFGVPEPDSEEAAHLLTEELLTVVDESRREGVIQSNASTMIHRVVDLQTEDVAAIMSPRPDMVTIAASMPLSDALPEMIANGHSRVPVIGDGIDDIVGILYARDLLSYKLQADESDSQKVADIARDVLYVPESQGIGDLLEAMQLKKVHMAIVVDEYSGVSGLVTLEDILEEIVGDISDEYDEQNDELWQRHTDGLTEVDARFHLDDLNEQFGYEFPEDEEFDTIGGFVLSCFGRIPATGDEHFWNGLKLTVMEADERHIGKVRIEGAASQAQAATSA